MATHDEELANEIRKQIENFNSAEIDVRKIFEGNKLMEQLFIAKCEDIKEAPTSKYFQNNIASHLYSCRAKCKNVQGRLHEKKRQAHSRNHKSAINGTRHQLNGHIGKHNLLKASK